MTGELARIELAKQIWNNQRTQIWHDGLTGETHILPSRTELIKAVQLRHDKFKAQKVAAKKSLPLLGSIKCDCGNVIKLFTNETQRKCYGCDHWYEKIDGKWTKQEKQDRNTNTIGSIISNKKHSFLG